MSKRFWRFCAALAAFFLWLGSQYTLQAQEAIPLGSWRTHFSYRQIRHVAVAKDRIYGAAQNGLFYFNKRDQVLTVLSTTDGLSDVGISAMAYQAASDALLLAYRSGQIDLLANNRIVGFSLLKNDSGSEQIHHILFQDERVYLSSSKGVRVLQVFTGKEMRIELIASYTNLGMAGDPLPVYGSAVVRDSIFLATAEGVIAASLAPQVNQQDFRNWKRFGRKEGLPAATAAAIVPYNGKLYAGLNGSGLYSYDSQAWQLVAGSSSVFSSLAVNQTQLLFTLEDAVGLYNGNNTAWIRHELINRPGDAVMDAEGMIWIGDSSNGLLRVQENTVRSFYPEGPLSDQIGRLKFLKQQIVALPDGGEGQQGAFSVFKQGNWTNFAAGAGLPVVSTLLDAAYEQSSGNFYFASFGSGMLQWDGDTSFELIASGQAGNTLENNLLTGLATDRNNALWVANFNTESFIHRYRVAENDWQAYASRAGEKRYPVKVILAEDGYPWVLTHNAPTLSRTGKDILVLNPETSDHVSVREKAVGGAFPGELITAMATDRNGQIWIGGNEGVAYFPNPWSAFSAVDVVKPIFDTQFLLLGEYVTALAVDGGNRKWIGTRKGLWLFSETGESLIHHFTTENSPLISDVIVDIAVNGTDGEVFVATAKGMVSYRAAATEGTSTHQSVKVFPNPVQPDFAGTVGIQGLASDAVLKITNVAGTLVREMRAEGGTASWDVRDYAGQRVGTGIYLLFSATADGEETFVGKIAVIG